MKEPVNFVRITGLRLGIGGAVMLIASGKNTGSGNDVLLGDCLILINAISNTFYFILVKPLMVKYNPVQVIRLIFSMVFFMVLPFGWNEFLSVDWGSFGLVEYACLGLIVIGGTFLA